MKNWIFYGVTAALVMSSGLAFGHDTHDVQRVEGHLLHEEDFDLETITFLVEEDKVRSAAHLEEVINGESGINNVDIDGDGYIDFVTVREIRQGNTRVMEFLAIMSSNPSAPRVKVASMSLAEVADDGYVEIVSHYPRHVYVVQSGPYYYTSRVVYRPYHHTRRHHFCHWFFTPYRPVYYYSHSYYHYRPHHVYHRRSLRRQRTVFRTRHHVRTVKRTRGHVPSRHASRDNSGSPKRGTAAPAEPSNRGGRARPVDSGRASSDRGGRASAPRGGSRAPNASTIARPTHRGDTAKRPGVTSNRDRLSLKPQHPDAFDGGRSGQGVAPRGDKRAAIKSPVVKRPSGVTGKGANLSTRPAVAPRNMKRPTERRPSTLPKRSVSRTAPKSAVTPKRPAAPAARRAAPTRRPKSVTRPATRRPSTAKTTRPALRKAPARAPTNTQLRRKTSETRAKAPAASKKRSSSSTLKRTKSSSRSSSTLRSSSKRSKKSSRSTTRKSKKRKTTTKRRR